ncbi:hypothetical protein IQ07DRAFT_121891 [Pyrenochaeta sp. DS3sAY3a]|nr:hypothetical protein IQ07DRAFT_121891 [Pyrenochaeta sp. DS3sAY3a]
MWVYEVVNQVSCQSEIHQTIAKTSDNQIHPTNSCPASTKPKYHPQLAQNIQTYRSISHTSAPNPSPQRTTDHDHRPNLRHIRSDRPNTSKNKLYSAIAIVHARFAICAAVRGQWETAEWDRGAAAWGGIYWFGAEGADGSAAAGVTAPRYVMVSDGCTFHVQSTCAQCGRERGRELLGKRVGMCCWGGGWRGDG